MANAAAQGGRDRPFAQALTPALSQILTTLNVFKPASGIEASQVDDPVQMQYIYILFSRSQSYDVASHVTQSRGKTKKL